MEPFEAQKLLVQKSGSKEELATQKPLHLYDTPYEAPEKESGPENQPSSQPAASCRYSWLPEDDERPPEEYDQPWEWKKERISRVFAATTVKNHVPACMEGKCVPCWLSPEDGAAFGEYVNPALPLESQAWYHGTLSRVDAENLLRLCREASYLVRNSESSHDAFSLSLKNSQGFLHMKLLQTEDNKFILGQHSPPFNNIPEVIHHYASHKLPIQGAEHMSLLYPWSILKRTL
uniref:SH2 domain-containing adapter protein D n=1 Tax=Laticauda laticaudata TaxID=8630 RepID=A0A8C5SLK6_LATLA